MLVLFYHFFRDALPGGFIGVDVFFTLSGFLVTVSMMAEFRKSGKFRFFSFVKRRFMRLYPPLLLSVVLTLPFTLLLSPDFTARIGRQIAAAFGFVTNYFEILNGGSYEAQLLPHLYVHTWFLAVEIQLYLLWGLICAGITFVIKKIFKESENESQAPLRILLFTVSITGALVSYLWMQTIYDNIVSDPSAAYFNTSARAFSFLLGAASGTLFRTRIKDAENEESPHIKAKVILTVCGIATLTAGIFILARFLNFSGAETYRFGLLAASVLALIIIRLIVILHELTPQIREPGFVTTTADLSYNIYLFHWPLFNVFYYIYWNNLLAAAIALTLSTAFSALAFYGLEPFFHKQRPLPLLRSIPLRRLFYTVVTLLIVTAVSLNGIVFAHAPEINSLEKQIYAGYLYQDADEIKALQSKTEAINKIPLVLSEALASLGRSRRGLDILTNPVPGEFTQSVPYLQTAVLMPNKDGIFPGVTIIGDSVCLGARKKLTEVIPDSYVDAEGSRQMWQGHRLLMQMQNNNTLREYVVVALGTNQNNNSLEYIDQIVWDLERGHRLIFVTPYNGAMNETWNTYKIMQYLRTLTELYSFVTIADWAALAEAQPRIMGPDKIHIAGIPSAVNLYTDCIIDAINIASIKPSK